MRRVLDWIAARARSSKNVWLFVFLNTLTAGLVLQFVLLPHVLTPWHAGDGLLKGLDGPKFNRIAMEQYGAMAEQGWQAWRLWAKGQFVSGVASALYALVYPKPWVLLPLNAALNATAAVCMVALLRHVTGDSRMGALSALPFILFPSSLLWNAQLHNEVYAVPGVCMLLLGWSALVRRDREAGPLPMWTSIILIGAGSLLVGAVRIYIVGVMLGLFLLAAAAVIMSAVMSWIRSQASGRAVGAQAAAMLLAAMTMSGALVALYGVSQDTDRLRDIVEEVTAADRPQAQPPLPQTASGDWWQSTSWLPRLIDNRFREVARVRRTYVREWANSGSAIDVDVELRSTRDLIAYLPRALQISLLSPFPNIWFTAGRKATGAAFRMAVVPETLAAYACLLGLPLAIWARRRAPALWMVLISCAGMLVFYGLVAPNQGTLYRFRFPYYLPIVCIGLSGWLQLAGRRETPVSSRAP